jgi:hypothetical protein
MKMYLVGQENHVIAKSPITGDEWISSRYFECKGFCFNEKDAKHLMAKYYDLSFADWIIVPVEINKSDINFSSDTIKSDFDKIVSGEIDNGKEYVTKHITDLFDRQIQKING